MSVSRHSRLALLALLAASTIVAGCGESGGEQSVSSGAPTPPCVEPEQVVQFSADDGVQLTGALWGEGDVGIVLAHMYNGDICQWRLFAPRLTDRFQVLAFDFRGYSSRHPQPASHIERDVAAAAAELRRRGAKNVVLIGGSMGGAVVLEAAAPMRPPPAGVVSLSAPIGSSGVDASLAVKTLTVPVLFMAARLDRDFAAEARFLWRAAKSPDKRLAIYPGALHGVDLVENAHAEQRVFAFIEAVT
jgi:pimeloyl-ACP methyl ester carboxylesterase